MGGIRESKTRPVTDLPLATRTLGLWGLKVGDAGIIREGDGDSQGMLHEDDSTITIYLGTYLEKTVRKERWIF